MSFSPPGILEPVAVMLKKNVLKKGGSQFDYTILCVLPYLLLFTGYICMILFSSKASVCHVVIVFLFKFDLRITFEIIPNTIPTYLYYLLMYIEVVFLF